MVLAIYVRSQGERKDFADKLQPHNHATTQPLGMVATYAYWLQDATNNKNKHIRNQFVFFCFERLFIDQILSYHKKKIL